jgi:vitamin B12 transporter
MWQLSPYASLVFNQGNFNFELGGRWNHHNLYGNNFTYTINPSYLFENRLKLFANISSAFKTPSLFQLFDPLIGNTMLDPEKSLILEGGLEWYANKVFARATGFHRKTKNAIQFIITDPVFFSGHYLNVSSQKNYGLETEFRYRTNKLSIDANYTFTKGSTISSYSQDGDPLPGAIKYNSLFRVPEHAVNIFTNYKLTKKLSVGSLVKYVGERLEPIFAAPPAKLENYFTIDLSGQYLFGDKFRAFADLKNITNREYQDILGYKSRKFNFDIGVDVRF